MVLIIRRVSASRVFSRVATVICLTITHGWRKESNLSCIKEQRVCLHAITSSQRSVIRYVVLCFRHIAFGKVISQFRLGLLERRKIMSRKSGGVKTPGGQSIPPLESFVRHYSEHPMLLLQRIEWTGTGFLPRER